VARILFAANPVSGHVRPGLPIARELVARGHEVAWYTSARFADLVERTGARHVGFTAGLEYDEADLDAAFPERSSVKPGIPQLKFDIRSLFIDPVVGHLEDLRALASVEPFDAIVVESVGLAGAFLAEELGLPWAVYGITPLTAKSIDVAPTGLGLPPLKGPLNRPRNAVLNTLVEKVAFASEQKRFNEMRAELGLPTTSTFFLGYPQVHAPVYIQGTIPELEYPRRDLPENVRFVGAFEPEPAGVADLPTWWGELETERPVVLVTQGTVKVDPSMLLEPAIVALAGDDVLVVGTTGGVDPTTIRGHDSENVRLEPFIPFADLLPHVDAVVTNGGYGGTQQALMHGIPAALAGITEAKLEVAARVAWTGAGINLRTDRPTPARISEAVQCLLTDDTYRTHAQELATRYAEHDAADEAAHLVEALPGVGTAERHGSPIVQGS
jgi:MGT family glycosyltransferase